VSVFCGFFCYTSFAFFLPVFLKLFQNWTFFKFELFCRLEHFFNLNFFIIWTIFKFELFQIWTFFSKNIFQVWTFLYLNNFQIWTFFRFEQFSNLKILNIFSRK
jgi:hypothetical protein